MERRHFLGAGTSYALAALALAALALADLGQVQLRRHRTDAALSIPPT